MCRRFKNLFLPLTAIILFSSSSVSSFRTPPPNIIVIYVDDLGYGDLGCYGSLWNYTPEIDRMATEGLKFTDFYAGATVCTPSRAALLTGSNPRRLDVDLDEKNRWVFFPNGKKGLNPNELTISKILKTYGGYKTAVIGKWHLGDQKEFLPSNFGFDYWFGLPYSNDMEKKYRNDPPLPLMKNDIIIEQHEKHGAFDQSNLTKRYTEEAIEWMEKEKGNPFFLYLAHTMPHYPADSQPEFKLKTNNPKVDYGASVSEVSWSTGQILDFLKKNDMHKNTLVLFTSDNGGDLRYGASNGILKGMKGQTHEGGIRVPFIAWWPGTIREGTVNNNLASVLDFFPTFMNLAQINYENNNIIDGIDITNYFLNPEIKVSPRPFFYWHVGYLHAVRYGNFKLSIIGSFNDEERKNIKKSGYYDIPEVPPVELFNLKLDPSEKFNIAENHPQLVEKLMSLIEEERKKLGQWTNLGPQVRKAGFKSNPTPLLK
ncbi:MAG: sulfatase [Jejuia sp.]